MTNLKSSSTLEGQATPATATRSPPQLPELYCALCSVQCVLAVARDERLPLLAQHVAQAETGLVIIFANLMETVNKVSGRERVGTGGGTNMAKGHRLRQDWKSFSQT